MLDKTIADFGGAKVDARPVKNPTSQLAADDYSDLAETVAEASRTADRAMVSFATIAAPGAVTATVNRTVWGSGALYTPVLARTGAGVYTVTYSATYVNGLGVTEAVNLIAAHGQVDGAAFGLVQCTMTSATVVTVRIFDAAGAPTDLGGGPIVTIWSR